MIRIICGALVVKKSKMAVVQEADKWVRGKWNIPAGHLEENENVLQATIREMKEETGLNVKIDGLVGVYQYKSKRGNNVISFYFKASVKSGALKPGDEIMDAKWISFKEFLKVKDGLLRSFHLKRVVRDYLKYGIKKGLVRPLVLKPL